MKGKKTIIIGVISVIVMAIIIMMSIVLLEKFEQGKNNVEKLETSISELKTNASIQESEKGEEISLDSEILKKIMPDFGNYLESVYRAADFDKENIPNDLVLLLGWNKLGYNHSDYDAMPNDKHFEKLSDGTIKLTVNKKEMEEAIKSIFGEDMKYTDKSFKDEGKGPTFIYSNTIGEIVFDKESGNYLAEWCESGGGSDNIMSQKIIQAVKYSDRIEVYVENSYPEKNDETKIGTYEYTFKLDDKNEYNFSGLKFIK